MKNTTSIVNFCKEANEIVVVNRNGLSKFILMSRVVYENGFGKVTEDVYFNVKRDVEKVVPMLRNGVDEIYAMDYASYQEIIFGF